MPDLVTLNEDSQARWNADAAEHLRYEYDLQPSDLVIDVGAYRGEWADEIFRRYKSEHIILIEPTDAILGYPRGTIINKAAGVQDGVIIFGGAYYYTSAYAEPTYGLRKFPCFDINELLRAHDEVALMKINIEGFEYTLLRHIIAAGLHQRIRYLQIQFHQVAGQPWAEQYADITERLSDTHHQDWCYSFCWESWSRK